MLNCLFAVATSSCFEFPEAPGVHNQVVILSFDCEHLEVQEVVDLTFPVGPI